MKINKNIDLRQLILEKVSQEQIFRLYYPYNFKLNEMCLSPFKSERNPSFIIGTKSQSGDIIFKSFNSNNKGDCFSFVMQMFGLDYIDALTKIQEDFGLKEPSGKKYESIISSIPVTKDVKQKKAPDIVVQTRNFNKEELKYWSDYYQDIEDLKENNIYVPKNIWINKKPIGLLNTDLTFCYYYPDIDKWKIYRPTRPKGKKWIGNVPLPTSWGLENIRKDKNTLITKSLKDYMICRKVHPYTVGVQNESIAAFSDQFVKSLKENSNKIFYGGDSDIPGKAASYLITQNFGFKHVNPKDEVLPDKDWADWAKSCGLECVYNHLKRKKVIA